MENLNKTTIRDRFFSPLEDALLNVKTTHKCNEFSDSEFIKSGVGRVLDSVKSGRDWIQKLPHFLDRFISVNCFFSALKSKRRLCLLTEVNSDIVKRCDTQADDPFSQHEELSGFAMYAMDAHFHKCSAHEDQIKGKKRAPGSIYALNLRSRSLQHLDILRPDIARDKAKEHDISAMKRIASERLRMNEPKGTKVLLVYDSAIVDYSLWYRWKQGKGIYVVTMEKGNSRLLTIGHKEFEKGDPRNNGVVADILVGNNSSGTLRRIVYRDPVDGTLYTFLTNELTLTPGLIAFIYKRRWDIEKLYDVKKNKLDEQKAWGKTAIAQCQQANFICIAYNLIVLFEQILDHDEGIVDEKVIKRIIAQKQKQSELARSSKREMNALVSDWLRPSQISIQFIRWLRHELMIKSSWLEAIARLRPLMANYLQ